MEFQEVVRAHLDTCLRLPSLNSKQFHAVASFAKQVNKITLLEVLFVKKLLRVNWSCCVLLQP